MIRPMTRRAGLPCSSARRCPWVSPVRRPRDSFGASGLRGETGSFHHPHPLCALRHRGRRAAQGLGSLAARATQELDQRRGLEVEHLRACEPAIADRVESEDGAVEALATWAEPALAPEYDHLVGLQSD